MNRPRLDYTWWPTKGAIILDTWMEDYVKEDEKTIERFWQPTTNKYLTPEEKAAI